MKTDMLEPPPLLFLVEGQHDAEFLRRLSRILARGDPACPDLKALEDAGRLVFIPLGGGPIAAQAQRFSPLGLREFHLYDLEIAPETARRQAACHIVNARPGCRAWLTGKRSLENYLHAEVLFAVGGLEITDAVHVPDLVARTIWESQAKTCGWSSIPTRARRRLRERAKHWLNRQAVEQMTPELLQERDPRGEVLNWLADVARLLETSH